VTFQEYEQNLEANLENLVERLKRQSYRARLVRRKHIPKGQGKTRPLGILVLEDKLVQLATAQILIAIYEADFYPCSYAYRPERGPQDAIRELTEELRWQKHNFVVEADIKGFFDNIQHEPLLKMLEQRVNDGALIRLIRKWLRAGILEEDGKVIHPELGTPQGGVISPVLANVYLHYVLDDWFEQEVRKANRGRSRLFRFADDFVACFEYRHEAAAFEKALKTRLAQYGLEVAPEKTKTIRFGQNGGGYNQRFDFLGLEFRWEVDRKGTATVKRRTSRKKLRGAVQRFSDWIKRNRSVKLRQLFKTLRAKYRGYWNYYGVIGNYPSLRDYYDQTVRLLYKWLNRRSQKRSLTWRAFYAVLDRFQVPRPRITEERRETQLTGQLAWTFGQVTAVNLFGKFYQRVRG
jgi:group II intron reverse transcriptase/maturase